MASLVTTTATGRRVNLDGALRVAETGVPDLTPPSPPAPLAPADALATPLAQLAFSWSPAGDPQSGVAAYRLRVDAANVATVGAGTTSAIPGAALAEGRHAWDVVAVDGFGNESASPARVLVVDRTPPGRAMPATPAAGARRTAGLVTLTWHPAADGLSGLAGYRVEVDGAAAASTGPARLSARVRLARGRHSWRVLALDAAGNSSMGAARSVIVSRAPRVDAERPGGRPPGDATGAEGAAHANGPRGVPGAARHRGGIVLAVRHPAPVGLERRTLPLPRPAACGRASPTA